MSPASALETTLGRVSLRMASSLEVTEVLGEITSGLVRDREAAMARIWLVRADEPGWLHLVASSGISERLDGSHAKVAIGALKIGEIAAKRAPVCTNDLVGDARFVEKRWLASEGLAAFAGYPLVFDGELLGVLAMFARRPLSEGELEQLGVFAAQAAIAIKNARLFAEVSELTRKLEAENSYLKEELGESKARGIVGASTSLRRVLDELARVAKTNTTVLFRGETGTGKELFARALHELSPRRGGPLVKVNCAAIAPTLFESEVFGHEKGAFTGATARRLGRFELAHRGTLFLDEIGELPLEAQAKLLRVLQEGELERVGGTASVPVDVRVVAATNRDLATEVKEKRFRADLYFRLNVFPIVLPPLRERRDDIRDLAAAFMQSLAARLGTPPKGIDADAVAYLESYDWPGNVRELHNVLERASILARGDRLELGDLPELERAREAASEASGGSLKDRVSAFERAAIVEALRAADDNQSEAARDLRMSRATLQYKMKLHRL